uniref:Delta-5 desaturase 4 n=1 Tax=Brachionus koreanus TaxID=1199090 RepID=A0A291LM85_9BILA|nr:delta-5 desaturase 4 [Brachionus koreanus]QBO56253.1 fatty acid desaturase 5/6-2 [Brachionus koreanus]
MGKGANLVPDVEEKSVSGETKIFKWSEIRQNKWIVIDNNVYDVTNFSKKHPGGKVILLNNVGQDATDAFTSFHKDMNKVEKYLKALKIGKVVAESDINQKEERKDELHKDFQQLRKLAEKMNLFKPSPWFYSLHFLQLIVLDLIGTYLIYKSGYENWFTYFIAVACLVTTQAQAGWLQHDLGHLSVFKSTKMNHFAHKVVICAIMGFSSDRWNNRHFKHHAKPNAIKKDPDIRFSYFYLLGKKLPEEVGKKKKGWLPYNLQQFYFFFTLPPVLVPILSVLEMYLYMIRYMKIMDMLWITLYYIRWYFMFVPSLGVLGAVKLSFLVRFFQSYWFIWSTQMSHLPMEVDYDQDLSWFRTQLITTCNVEQSAFNDWVSGHLNFQIEHHLFPTMPRHNLYKIAPHVKQLCEKYGIEYQCKTMSQATFDIYNCLKESGEIWYEAYNS